MSDQDLHCLLTECSRLLKFEENKRRIPPNTPKIGNRLILLITVVKSILPNCVKQGAQWLSDRVLDSELRGHGFEPHRGHCIVVLEEDTFILA